ncbi:MAG: long-chain-acyl-CoA synthetase [Frankiales bacterium]|nr:long-chain-acyl-CoA synthetase [Frankiales bacterium]
MTATDVIPARQYYSRLLRKLARPGVLTALVSLQRLDGAALDSAPAQLERAARTWPDRPAIKFEGGTWTWSEVDAWVNRYAHVLHAQGVRSGDVVAVVVPNRPQLLVATMAALKLGAVAALVNTGLRGESLSHSLRLVEPTAVVVGEEVLDAVTTLDVALPAAVLYLPDTGTAPVPDGWTDLEETSLASPSSRPPETAGIRLRDPAVYIYTSGTTGLPKASITTHQRLRQGGQMVGRVVQELTPDDTVYCPLPLYHSTGLLAGWSACMTTGAALVPARRFSASQFWDDVRAYDVTSFRYVGEMLRYLLAQPAGPGDRDHRVSKVLGAGLRPELWDVFKQRFGIEQVHEIYGGSESPAGFMNLLNFDRTCGWNPRGWKAVRFDPATGAAVRGPDGRCTAVAPGESGLLVMKIDAGQPFRGYTDDEATQKKVLRDVFAVGDAWFDSGDVVVPQGHGHMRFGERTGDTFRWRSENVAAAEVEAAVGRWHQVADSAVYGVEVAGSDGRCGMVQLVLKDGEELDAAGLAAHLRAELPGFAVPRLARLSPTAQMTGTFKHQKKALQEDGYDLDKVQDPLLLLVPGETAWRALTREDVDALAAGGLRL